VLFEPRSGECCRGIEEDAPGLEEDDPVDEIEDPVRVLLGHQNASPT
jgi:hypothetical protein